jgi:hypothetical protein
MTKPKNMTPEQEAAWREKDRAYTKAWREANKEKVQAHKKAYREAHKEKDRAIVKAWREANKEKVQASKKAWGEAQSKNLTDTYVLNALRIPTADCHKQMISLKREQLEIYRATRELVATINQLEKAA